MEPEPEEKCKLILLNTKTGIVYTELVVEKGIFEDHFKIIFIYNFNNSERLAGTTLFDAARLIFYDFDSIRDESVLDEWEAGEKFDQIYMLITDVSGSIHIFSCKFLFSYF